MVPVSRTLFFSLLNSNFPFKSANSSSFVAALKIIRTCTIPCVWIVSEYASPSRKEGSFEVRKSFFEEKEASRFAAERVSWADFDVSSTETTLTYRAEVRFEDSRVGGNVSDACFIYNDPVTFELAEVPSNDSPSSPVEAIKSPVHPLVAVAR